MKKYLGFTLSELIVAIAVLGILSAIVLPMLLRNNPNQNKMMMKKAYYTTSNVISDMINDTKMYPSHGDQDYQGFDNTIDIKIGGETYGGDRKFARLFQNFLNVDKDLFENQNTLTHPCDKTPIWGLFKTQDGMTWCIEQNTNGYKINIDTNGDKKPNCYQGSTVGECANRTKNFDTFSIVVDYNGKISLPDDQTWAKEAVSVNSDVNSD